MLSARPVENASEPIASPPPNRRIVPQSMRTAWSQVSVKRRDRQLTGSRNRRMAPIMAATASGIAES